MGKLFKEYGKLFWSGLCLLFSIFTIATAHGKLDAFFAFLGGACVFSFLWEWLRDQENYVRGSLNELFQDLDAQFEDLIRREADLLSEKLRKREDDPHSAA